MKTLSHHTIIYDDECPLCSGYTRAFVKTGMLDGNGREAYTELVNRDIPNLDWRRARNEIALINKKDNSIQYGVDSLMTILGHSLPMLKPLFRFRAFRSSMNRLYFFISYNRKVIAPGKSFEGQNVCTPDLNYAYRWSYILFAWLITSWVLASYSRLAFPVVPSANPFNEFAVCGGQIVFQGIIVATVRKERLIHYLGNMMTVSLACALLLTPMLLLPERIDSNLFYEAYFMMIAGLLFFEHRRRVKILELPWYISAVWMAYLVLVLIIASQSY